MSSLNIAIVGGHGRTSLRLARLLTNRPNTQVTSIIRNAAHSREIAATGATPLVRCLENDPKEAWRDVFEGKDLVYFAAGAGDNDGPDRLRKIDYMGALKVFDAIELVRGPKPRLIMLSALDVRDRSRRPTRYTNIDVKHSDQIWTVIGPYMQAKYDADKNLATRTAFRWTMLRPGWLTYDRGTGRISLGRDAGLNGAVSRDDVAAALVLLADRPDADGLGINMNAGPDKMEDAFDAFIKRGESDFEG